MNFNKQRSKHTKKYVKTCFFIVYAFYTFCSFSFLHVIIPVEIKKFLQAYPNEMEFCRYDSEKEDWLLRVNGSELYWAGSRFLPKEELSHSDNWRPYIDYVYPEKIPDPSDTAIFTPEHINHLKSDKFYKSRKNQQTYNTSFYVALYDCATRASTESHIKKMIFLEHRLNIHEKLIPILQRVEKKIYEYKDAEIQNKTKVEYGTVQFFLEQLSETQGYAWREVSDTSNPSQHSRGIAVDVLPIGWKQKNMYWRWRADWDEDWMLLPLDQRWMPAPDVIKAFESEGFIWGGKWGLWDNMHFEYRPELCGN